MTSKFSQMKQTDDEQVRRATPLPIQKAKVVRTPSHPSENGYHQVYVKLYYDDSQQRAIVTTGKQGDVSIPEEGEDVFVLFGAADKPVVIDSFYPVDDEFGRANENVPEYEPGDRIVGNGSGSYFGIKNGGTINISSTGRQPINVDRQRAVGYLTSPQSVPGDNNFYTVQYDTEGENTEDIFDPTTHTMTLIHEGTYEIKASFAFTDTGQNDVYTIALFVNGQQEKRKSRQSVVNNELSLDISLNKYLEAGDEIDVRVRQNSGSSHTLDGTTQTNDFTLQRNGV